MDDQTPVGKSVGEEVDSDQWLQWPCCPQCGKRRQTFCRTCDLAGDDFGLAEFIPTSEPIGITDTAGENTGGQPSSPRGCCGSMSCSSGGSVPGSENDTESRTGGTSGTSRGASNVDDHDLPVLLFCPDCSEAFSPSFFRLCAQCGHDFGDGRVVAGPRPNEMNNRVLIAILALAGLAIGSLVYFWMLFQ